MAHPSRVARPHGCRQSRQTPNPFLIACCLCTVPRHHTASRTVLARRDSGALAPPATLTNDAEGLPGGGSHGVHPRWNADLEGEARQGGLLGEGVAHVGTDGRAAHRHAGATRGRSPRPSTPDTAAAGSRASFVAAMCATSPSRVRTPSATVRCTGERCRSRRDSCVNATWTAMRTSACSGMGQPLSSA